MRRPASDMTAAEFKARLDWLDVSTRAMAEYLGISRQSVEAYRDGRYPVPRPVAIIMRDVTRDMRDSGDNLA